MKTKTLLVLAAAAYAAFVAAFVAIYLTADSDALAIELSVLASALTTVTLVLGVLIWRGSPSEEYERYMQEREEEEGRWRAAGVPSSGSPRFSIRSSPVGDLLDPPLGLEV